MSGTAVLRSAARRALRPTTTRFRRTLVANNEQTFSPMKIITPRRHYSAGGGVNMEKGLNSTPAARHTFMTVDEVSSVFDTRNLLIRQLVEDKLKYERLKRVLVRVPIYVAIGICVNKYFSGGGDEEAKNNMTESDY